MTATGIISIIKIIIMKNTKVFWHGKRLKDIYVGATKWEVFKYKARLFFEKGLLGLVAAIFLTGSFYLGGYLNPVTKILAIEPSNELPPIMVKIAVCESGNSQYDKNHQVYLYANKDGSTDIGKFMINNKIWGKKATELGYNLMVEQDNQAFAMWLFNNYGSAPWVNSAPCWNK